LGGALGSSRGSGGQTMAAIRFIAYRLIGRPWIVLIMVSLMCSGQGAVWAQEKLTFSYAAPGAANSIWNIAKDVGFYRLL
jgi:hypothetical protein